MVIRVFPIEQRCDFQSNFLIVLIGFAIAFGLESNGVAANFIRIKLILNSFLKYMSGKILDGLLNLTIPSYH